MYVSPFVGRLDDREENGMDLVRNIKRVGTVVLPSGSRVSCEMVVAGVGAVPVTELLAETGLEVENGIVVNEYLEANQGGVYAAGDVA